MTAINNSNVQKSTIAQPIPILKNIQELPSSFLEKISSFNNPSDKDNARKTSGFMKMNFGNITELYVIRKYKTSIKEVDITTITTRNKDNLIYINLTNCFNISDKIIIDIAKLKNLTSLNLSYCLKIKGKNFGSLRNVKYLDLAGCTAIVPAGFKNFAGLSQLNSLILSDCTQINDKDIVHFKNLKHLTRLDLSRCRYITDAIYNYLKPLLNNQLELNLSGCMKMKKKQKTLNRHKVLDPMLNNKNLEIWETTLKKDRIKNLFLTENGLSGHVQQIQCEINRISLEGLTLSPLQPELVTRSLKSVKLALSKSKEAHEKSGSFSLTRKFTVTFPLINDSVII